MRIEHRVCKLNRPLRCSAQTVLPGAYAERGICKGLAKRVHNTNADFGYTAGSVVSGCAERCRLGPRTLSEACGRGGMQTAFEFLGIKMTTREIEEIFAEVDDDGSGEIEFPEFLELMTNVNERSASDGYNAGVDNGVGGSEAGTNAEDES